MKRLLAIVAVACSAALCMAGVAESQCANGRCLGGVCPIPQNQWHGSNVTRGVNRVRVLPTGIWRSVVRVEAVQNERTVCQGSGVLVRHRGRVVVMTAYHVLKGAKRIIVGTYRGVRFPARLIFCEPKADSAILEVSPPKGEGDYVIAETASTLPRPGESVQVVGYGEKGTNFGVISGKLLQFVGFDGMNKNDILEVSGGAQEGDSGGPIFNSRGEVIGVTTGTNGRVTNGPQVHRILKLCADEKKWSLLPWRAKQEAKVDALARRVISAEAVAAQATSLASQPPLPQHDSSVANDRLSNLEGQVAEQLKMIDANTARFEPLEATADKARQLAEQWPEMKAQLDAMKSRQDTNTSMAGDALGAAAKAQTTLDEALDEEKGPLAKIKARLDERLESTLTAKLAARVAEKAGWSMPAALGVTGGGLGLLAVLLVLFLKRETGKAGEGEQILLQRLAAMTPGTRDDAAADKLAGFMAKMDAKHDALTAKLGEVAAKIKPGS